MTHQQKLDFIRKKCCEANPALMELGFGCRLLDVQYGEGYVEKMIEGIDGMFFAYFPDYAGGVRTAYSKEDKKVEILGRLPTLADVLLAINANHKPVYVYSSGQVYRKGGEYLGCWKMSLPFDQQDEPCIDFIYELLK